MKKLLSLILLTLMVLSLASCKQEPAPEEPIEVKTVSVLKQIDITWNGKTTNYISGQKLTVNDAGEIAAVSKLYNDYTFDYSTEGLLEKINIETKSSGKMGYKSFTYDAGKPTSYDFDPNDGFHSLKKADTSVETDAEGRILSMTENTLITDVVDGTTETAVIKYEYEYDADGKIASIKYYSNDKLDHTTLITYNEDGLLDTYSNIGAKNNNKYLSVQFKYEMVDESTVNLKDVDNFNQVYNFENILNQIL